MLADIARIGPFFTVATGPDVATAEFRPIVELFSDPTPMRARIFHVANALRTDDRVAASIAFQGLAAGLVSAPLAAAVAHGVVPRFAPSRLYVRPLPSGPWPLWLPDAEGEVVGPEATASVLDRVVLRGVVEPLVAVVRTQVRVAERVLWGNVASAVAGAKRVLVHARPELAIPAAEAARQLLARGPLAGTGRLLPASAPDVCWSFRRSSCCLYYRVADGGLCEDCVLHDRRRH